MSNECDQTSTTLRSPPTEQEKADALATVLKALGVGPCKSTSAAAAVATLLPPAFGGAAVSTSIGCDQIDVVVNSVVATQRNLNCLVKNIVESQGVSIRTDQKIVLKLYRTSGLDININQVSADSILLLTNLTEKDQLNIGSELKQFNTEFFKSLQDAKTGYLATPQGQKSVSDFTTNFSQENVNKVIRNTILKVQADADTKQDIEVVIDGYDPLSTRYYSVGNINLSQESYILIKSAQILNTFLEEVFKTDEGQTLKQDITKGMKSDARGLDDLVGKLASAGILLLALLGVGLFFFGGSIAKYIIPIGLIAAVMGAVFFSLKKPPQVLYAAIAGAITLFMGILEIFALREGGGGRQPATSRGGRRRLT